MQCRYVAYFLLFIGLSSCGLLDPNEEIPGYLKVEDYTFQTVPSTEGSASEKITAHWVYVDNTLVGAFEVPYRIPLVELGISDIQIYAGINNNGLSATKEEYPFYAPYLSTSVMVESGKVIEITPQFSYDTDAKFVLIEDFEKPILQLDSSARSGGTIKLTSDAFEGNFAGRIDIDRTHFFAEILSTESLDVTRNGYPIYLELNFKGTFPFQIGVKATNVDGSVDYNDVAGLVPDENEWKKIYMEFTNDVNEMRSAESYQLLIHGNLGNFEDDEGYIIIDNVKVITF